MKEAQDGYVVLEEVHEETFIRFGEYIYTGDYNAADPQTVLTESQNEHESSLTADDGWGEFGLSSKKSQFLPLKSPPAFADLEFSVSNEPPFSIDPMVRANKSPAEDYTDVFMSHIHLYAFADAYNVDSLKSLICRKLHQTLKHYTLYPQRVGDIITLIEHSYQNTSELEYEKEPLRSLIAHYTASNFKLLVQSQAFQDVLAKGGSFVKDVSQRVADRL